MMCCCRLSPLPLSGDVLGVVSTCLLVATLCLCLTCTLSLERITELRSEKNQNIKQTYRLVPHAEPMWAALENNSTYRKTAAVVPSCGQKSEKQAGMREGLVMAELKTDLDADRSVQLVLIPVHVYNCLCVIVKLSSCTIMCEFFYRTFRRRLLSKIVKAFSLFVFCFLSCTETP